MWLVNVRLDHRATRWPWSEDDWCVRVFPLPSKAPNLLIDNFLTPIATGYRRSGASTRTRRQALRPTAADFKMALPS